MATPMRVPEPGDDCPSRVADAELQSCRSALDKKCVTFHDVAVAWWGVTNDRLSDDQRDQFTELYPQLRDAFGAPRGGIVSSMMCCRLHLAAALTSTDQAAKNPEGVLTSEGRRVGGDDSRERGAGAAAIHIETAHGDPVDLTAKEIIFRCLDLHNRAVEFLSPKPRKVVMRAIFGVVTSLLGTLDRTAGKLGDDQSACLCNELDRAEANITAAMQRQAQWRYFAGMLCSWAGLLVVFGGAVAVAAATDHLTLMKHLLALTPLAGGLGAVVSVMQRMTNGGLRLAAQDSRIFTLGAIRPALGAILGLVLFVFLSGRLIPITGEDLSANAKTYYILGLAFIAGFSERFAQDMLSGAAKTS